MRPYSQRPGPSTLSEINVTPLLDLAFVLLIIFMITTPLLESSMNLVIPSSGATNPTINSSQVQTISIDRAETIRFNNQVIDLENLTTQLIQLKQANPDVAIVIRPDRELPVQKLITLMDTLRRAQITKVGIATKAESKEMPQDARLWRNVTLIALAHVALLLGLIRWSVEARNSSNAQSIVWISGGEDLAAGEPKSGDSLQPA